ncbi:MAG: DEAD/DEAH box helicase [Chloroflexi bacterium]|nr:DEAD/DEAH box helicase [Chloroflexota bacterium]
METFAQLGLRDILVEALNAVGYETPTPIQRQTIPLLLAGRDLIGQAQTGTGKTAAFALPILEKLDLTQSAVQALILTPTRELAIQVAEAIHTYAKHLGRVRITPIYGGDSMQKQLSRLRGGVHVVVGTPGRVMDHLRRGTLELSALKMVVLDEADEMLRMGFLEDVEWILSQAAGERQTALFSATLPREVRRIAERYLQTPASVEIKHKTLTVPTVEQHFVQVLEKQKLEVLTHLLEAEAVPGEAILIFVRTKLGAADLAERLEARGYTVEAMHGDMNQSQRESVIRRMREGLVEIVVATDVAARGLDVEHIGHVINFDIPNDPESYVHRIGRTARAGRAGKAILFVTPREAYMMREIERYTGQRLTLAKAPTHADVAARRRTLFKNRLLKTLAEEELEAYVTLIEELAAESDHDLAEIAAAAAWLARGNKPLGGKARPEPAPATPATPPTEGETVQLWVGAGLEARVRPADLVGAIANEAEVPGKEIGPIVIYDDYSVVGVPARYLNQVLQSMAGASIRGREAALRLATARDIAPRPPRRAAHSESPHSSRRKPARTTGKEFSKPAKRDTKGKKKKRVSRL